MVLVDHAIFRAFNKGALAAIEVTGEEQPDIFRHGTATTDVAAN